MNRDARNALLAWKASARRKPLLVRGARQTGKTHLLQEFGNSEYAGLVYLNFEADPALAGFFARDLDPHRILADLAIHTRRPIRPGVDLVVLDEVQACDRALSSLKYFREAAGEYHVAAAGSLVGVKLARPGSFPVGKVSFLNLHPLTFLEFLDAVGDAEYRRILESLEGLQPLADGFHAHLVDRLRSYYAVGGMPEAVDLFARTGDLRQVREVQAEIVDSYVLDFAKHAPAPDIPRLTLLWDSIPKHLARENKKFVFSAVRPGARSREFEDALTWLEDAGLIHRAWAVETSRLPLKHYADRSSFKVYPLDVGLLGSVARTSLELALEPDRLFNEYDGAFVESYVAQQLLATDQEELYYWRSPGGKAELDFLIDVRGKIVPLEVSAGVNPRSKSLASFDAQYAPPLLARSNLLNLRRDGRVGNVPLYAVSELTRLLAPEVGRARGK